MDHRWFVPRVLAAAMSCALAACGGGGGDGGSDGPTVTASGTGFQLVGLLPGSVGTSSMTFTLTDSKQRTYYAGATTQMTGLGASLSTDAGGTAVVTLSDQSGASTPGRTSGTVTFHLCSDQACTHDVWTHDYPVTITRFQVDTTPLTLAGREGTASKATVSITPPDTDHVLHTLVYSMTGAAADWLTLAYDASGNLVANASGAGLHAGNYTDGINIAASPTSGALNISVAFNVGLDMSTSALADIVERIDSTAATLRGSGSVAFAGASGAWTATSSAPWLVVDTPSGTGAGTFAYHIDQAAADAAVGNWASASATVTVKSPGLSDAVSTLAYRRQLPEVAMVTPSQIWPGQAASVRVTGRGLSQLAGVGAIQVGGQAADGGTIDSDIQATLQLAARPARSLQIAVPNPLGVATTQANLAVTPGRFAYAVVPTTGDKNAIVYDPSRRAIFAASNNGATLVRWQFDGTAWNTMALPWADIWRVQMSPDRQTLFVLDKSVLSEVDPDTLVTRTRHTGLTWGGNTYDDQPLPITSDQRMWLPDSSFQYFDLRRRTLVTTPDNTFAGGTGTMAATPDGAHMYGVEGRFSPAPPDNWYAAATSTSTALPGTTLQFNYRASFDLFGDVGLFEWESVWNTGTWTLAGKATLPASESGYGAVMSPDGKRVYRLAGPHTNNQLAMDHVDVFDTTQLVPGTSQFVQVGTIAVAAPAVACNDFNCDGIGRLQIDALGATLFWAGNARFVVLPIPAAMSGTLAAGTRAQHLMPATAAARR